MISNDEGTVVIFNIIVLSIVGILVLVVLIGAIIWICLKVKELMSK
jgi:hypothetical protein